MQHLLRGVRARHAALRAARAADDSGFTLIELLVVVVIIGVLVAIAVPTYLGYRQGAADKSAQSDIRSAISSVEAYYTNNGNVYPADEAAALALTTATPAGAGVKVTSGVTFDYTRLSASVYCIDAAHSDGTGTYFYRNDVGGAPVKGAC